MRNPKRADPRPHPHVCTAKSKGEYAELQFMAKMLTLGFFVCRPYGDNLPFDFVVFAPGTKVSRIQVKSSWTKTENVYRFKATGFGGRRYRPQDVDFIVVFVVPEDAWYVIPRSQARYASQYVAPHNPRSRCRWERYRDAWHLLRCDLPGYGIRFHSD